MLYAQMGVRYTPIMINEITITITTDHNKPIVDLYKEPWVGSDRRQLGSSRLDKYLPNFLHEENVCLGSRRIISVRLQTFDVQQLFYFLIVDGISDRFIHRAIWTITNIMSIYTSWFTWPNVRAQDDSGTNVMVKRLKCNFTNNYQNQLLYSRDLLSECA